MITLHTSDLFPPSFKDDFRSILRGEYTKYTEAGGRGSCKSSFISICIIILMMMNRAYNAVCLRKVDNTLRDSVFTQIKWATEKLGVADRWIFTTAPMQATYTPTGQTIIFRGSNDPGRIKSIKTLTGYTAITWFEELTEFTAHDMETVKLSTMRGGDRFFIFNSYNPPAAARNWCNEHLRHPDSDEHVHLTDYRSVPPEWLGAAFIHEAEEMKARNERAYKNIFLGEPTGTGRSIFENIELRQITDAEIAAFEWCYYGIDWGYYPDPFRFAAMAYDMQRRTLYIWDELTLYKHGNQESAAVLKDHMQEVGIDPGVRITTDSAEEKSTADFRAWGWNVRGAIKGPGSLDAGFKWLQQLDRIIIDPERAPKTADEFSLYEYDIDRRTGEVLTGYPQGQPDHSMAAVRYALEEIWRRRGF
jgi:PBSX family phage terminase large subunit